jgi:hypothetical protein
VKEVELDVDHPGAGLMAFRAPPAVTTPAREPEIPAGPDATVALGCVPEQAR